MLILSFILLIVIVFIVMVFVFRNILNRNVISATTHLEELSGEYAEREKKIKKQLEDTQRQCQELSVNAKKDAEKQREDILKQVAEEKKKILQEAQQKSDELIQQADRTRQSLIDEMDHKIEERAIKRAVELVQQALPEAMRRQIHIGWVQELISGSSEQLERLQVPDEVSEARIVTAFSLTGPQQKALGQRIKEKLGRAIQLKEEVDPAVLAGLVVNIGSLVLDGSLRFMIQEVAREQESGDK